MLMKKKSSPRFQSCSTCWWRQRTHVGFKDAVHTEEEELAMVSKLKYMLIKKNSTRFQSCSTYRLRTHLELRAAVHTDDELPSSSKLQYMLMVKKNSPWFQICSTCWWWRTPLGFKPAVHADAEDELTLVSKLQYMLTTKGLSVKERMSRSRNTCSTWFLSIRFCLQIFFMAKRSRVSLWRTR